MTAAAVAAVELPEQQIMAAAVDVAADAMEIETEEHTRQVSVTATAVDMKLVTGMATRQALAAQLPGHLVEITIVAAPLTAWKWIV